jgi:small subunit ribosomal protein S8
VRADNIPRVLRGLGINIVSTNKGVLTDAEARKIKCGGELLCSVW